MRFRIYAANRETGSGVSWEQECHSVADATNKANAAGFLVSDVRPVSDPQPPSWGAASANHPAASSKLRKVVWKALLFAGLATAVVVAAIVLWPTMRRAQPQQQARQPGVATPRPWDVFQSALKECDLAKEFIDDADDPSAPSRRKKAAEAEQHFENGKRLVANLRPALQIMYELKMEEIIEFRAGRIAGDEAKLLNGYEAAHKNLDAMEHMRKAKVAMESFVRAWPEMAAKYD